MRITNFIKAAGAAIAISSASIMYTPVKAEVKPDTFERIVTPAGTQDSLTLKNAPNPEVTINGETHKAVIVVDIEQNTLYKYDKDGSPEKAYLVCSGKAKTPTKKRISVVSHVEKFPYKYAPANSKRKNNPYPYGANIIVLDKVDPETGEKTNTGQWIHGNNKASSIGKRESQGCIRMDNEVIKQLSAQVKRGDIVLFK